MKKNYTILGLVAVVLLAGLGYFVYVFNKGPLSYVSISINPDIELAVNSSDVVREVITVNEDADILVSDLNLVGMTIEEASDAIVEEAIETGFIDEYGTDNEVIVTVNNEDEAIRGDLEEKVVTRLNSKFEEKKVYPIVVSMGINDDIRAEADQFGISDNKMLFIERAVMIDPTLTKEELVDLEINEIQQVIREYVASRHEVMKQTRAELKNAWKQEKEELKEMIRTKRQTLQDSVFEEAGVNPKDMTTAARKEFIEAALKDKKDDIKEEINLIKEELKNHNSSYSNIKDTIDNIKESIKKGTNKR